LFNKQGKEIVNGKAIITELKDFTKISMRTKIPTTFGFKKAFDSLSWQFLFHTLRAFTFGNSFIRWVEVLYSNILSCVMNMAFASDLFQIKRGVRQGDQLSPYFLSSRLKFSISLHGNAKKSKESKWEIMNQAQCLLKNSRSFIRLKHLINGFGNVSGLKLN